MKLKLAISIMSLVATMGSAAATELTLKQIMADPDWIGRAPVSAYWSDDSKSILYLQKELGQNHYQTHRVELATDKTTMVMPAEQQVLDSRTGVLNADRTLKLFARSGDLFIKNLSTGQVRALTQTLARESQPQFIDQQWIQFRRGNGFYRMHLSNGLIKQLVEVKLRDEPKDDELKSDFLSQQQTRLFDYVKKQQDARAYRKEQQEAADKAAVFPAAKEVYLGKGQVINHITLAKNGRYLFIATAQEGKDKLDNMPVFITEDGYVENQSTRTLVGQERPVSETYWLYDLSSEKLQKIKLDDLSDINDDPLAKLKRAAAKARGEKYKKTSEQRAIYIHSWTGNGLSWSDDGQRLAVKLYSYDNKSRWLAEVDFQRAEFIELDHLFDEAWVNDWTFNQMGWLPDNQSFYFLSERDGYSHLYLKRNGSKAKALTKGKFEVSDVSVTQDGKHIFFKSNKKHPGIYNVYKLSIETGKVQALTDLDGIVDYRLAPDESQLLLTYSTTNRPPELFTLNLQSGALKQITNTVSKAFSDIAWTKPQIVAVPSQQTKMPIYSRLYLPKDFDASKAKDYPAVIFVHGAGYLQNAHYGWSVYFREFMFHSLLNQKGYVVLDMDYRASKGYGRDWRTAIYQQMGTPELEDLLSGKQWLTEQYGVNPSKVGIYGGSYGGFMTFMALFKAPGEFAAGASLRPVTDWASYNHGYTSNILNTPEVDPKAYDRSSPIEFAAGLADPLLIAHGMVDDNVFFKDSVRLVQKLIELEKSDWFETAIYPVEPHGFREPSSWLDEYHRILKLFENHVKK